MNQRAVDLKQWSLNQFSPLAWSRITLRALPVLSENGIDLDTIQDPPMDLVLSGNALISIHEAIFDLYKVEVPAVVKQ